MAPPGKRGSAGEVSSAKRSTGESITNMESTSRETRSQKQAMQSLVSSLDQEGTVSEVSGSQNIGNGCGEPSSPAISMHVSSQVGEDSGTASRSQSVNTPKIYQGRPVVTQQNRQVPVSDSTRSGQMQIQQMPGCNGAYVPPVHVPLAVHTQSAGCIIWLSHHISSKKGQYLVTGVNFVLREATWRRTMFSRHNNNNMCR